MAIVSEAPLEGDSYEIVHALWNAAAAACGLLGGAGEDGDGDGEGEGEAEGGKGGGGGGLVDDDAIAIGGRQAQSTKGVRGVRKRTAARRNGPRTTARATSGAGHERADAAVTGDARLRRAAVGPRSTAAPGLLVS